MKTQDMVRGQYEELVSVVKLAENGVVPVAAMGELMVETLKAGGTVLAAGNGGSATDAMHVAEELTGRYRSNRRPLPGIALSADGSALTCIGNDFGFEAIFSRQLEALGRKGDLFVLFSTSGNSKNLSLAIEIAKKKEIKIIALLGKDGGEIRGKADVEWVVPSKNTARIQEMHTWALHVMLEAVESAFPTS